MQFWMTFRCRTRWLKKRERTRFQFYEITVQRERPHDDENTLAFAMKGFREIITGVLSSNSDRVHQWSGNHVVILRSRFEPHVRVDDF
jgi:hypothetical protein